MVHFCLALSPLNTPDQVLNTLTELRKCNGLDNSEITILDFSGKQLWAIQSITNTIISFPKYNAYSFAANNILDVYNEILLKTKKELICYVPIGSSITQNTIQQLINCCKDENVFCSSYKQEIGNEKDAEVAVSQNEMKQLWKSPIVFKTKYLKSIVCFKSKLYKEFSLPLVFDTVWQIRNITNKDFILVKNAMQITQDIVTIQEQSKDNLQHDFELYAQRSQDENYNKKIIYIDGGLGDHVCALPLLREFSKIYCNNTTEYMICCRYNEFYQGVKNISQQFLDWNHPLFGGAVNCNWALYAQGSEHNAPTLKDAYCNLYGLEYKGEKTFSYVKEQTQFNFTPEKKYVIIAPSAARINDISSNKNWNAVDWMNVVYYLQKLGYNVVQLYKNGDEVIPNTQLVNNPSIEETYVYITQCSFWIAIDSFIHHFATSIGKRGVCITPQNNQHAYHPYNLYVEGKVDVALNNKWWLDSQQPERALSMKAISYHDVVRTINELQLQDCIVPIHDSPYLEMIKEKAQQVPAEIKGLQNEVALLGPSTVVEIGTSLGGTLVRWLELQSPNLVISMDYPDGIHGGAGYDRRQELQNYVNEYVQFHKQKTNCIFINADSHEQGSVDSLKKTLAGKQIDFLFIDGDHRYKDGVLKDFLMYADLVREGGIIAFHDVLDSEWQKSVGADVDILWNELKQFGFKTRDIFGLKQDAINIMPASAPHGFGGIGIVYFEHEKFNNFKLKHEDTYTPTTFDIIIPCYNNFEISKQCVESIQQNTKYPYNLIIVNNGSTPEQNELYSQYFGSLQNTIYISESEALGFSGAVNKGINAMVSKYCVILNNDTQVGDGWLEILYTKMKENTSNALIGISKRNNTIPGFCWLVSKKAFEVCGLLNIGYEKGYYEDNDFCDRLKNAGFICDVVCNDNKKLDSNENYSVNFPINHLGMGTTRHLENINDHIMKNKKKYERHKTSDSNICFTFISYDIETLKKNFNVFYTMYDNVSMSYLVLTHNQKVGRAFIDYIKTLDEKVYQRTHVIELFERKENVFVNDEQYKKVASSFFKCNEDNIFLIFDKPYNDNKYIDWLALFNDHASMGILSQKYIENFSPSLQTTAKTIIGESTTSNSLIKHKLQQPSKNKMGIMFAYPYMHNELQNHECKIIFTGSDTDGGMSIAQNGRDDFAINANNADILFTPSFISKKYMQGIGITKPIFVIPHGIDTTTFSYKHRIKQEKYTFLYIGELGDRKGTFQLIEAFNKAFRNNQSVQLILHSNKDMEDYWKEGLEKAISSNPNIILKRDNITQDKIAEIMQSAHCYVYPSRADTFGMTVIEALGAGLPVIANNGLGYSDFINEDVYTPVKTNKTKISYHPWMLGKWLESDVQDLTEKMRYQYEQFSNPTPLTKDSESISKYIHENFNWNTITKNIFEPTINLIYDNKIVRKKKEIGVLLTSFNRHDYLVDTLLSLVKQEEKEYSYQYNIHIIEQSSYSEQQGILESIKGIQRLYKNAKITVHSLDNNIGQRGAMQYAFTKNLFGDSDYILCTDHDNIFKQPLSKLSDVLDKHKECFISTGYFSREHPTNDIIRTEEGTIALKSTCRAGCMMFRKKQLYAMFPINLDSQYTQPWNSSWNIGFDWEVTYWNKKSPAALGYSKFVYCLSNIVEHIGLSSTWNTNEGILDFEVPLKTQKQISYSTSLQEAESLSPEKH